MTTVPDERLVRSPRPATDWSRRLVPTTLAGCAVLLAWWYVAGQATGSLPDPATTAQRASGLLRDLLGLDAGEPAAFVQASRWRHVGGLVLDTLVMSVVAVGLAGAGVLVDLGPATRSLTTGEFGPRARWVGRLVLLLTRGTHAVCRAVPELIWALLIVFVLRPGILAGALALAVHEFGVIGRLSSDVVDDLDPRPLRSLRRAGANGPQLLLHGALPQVLPQLVTFLLYRWEVVIRATVVVGFVTGAGLGHQLRLDLSFRRWTEVALVLLTYVLLVWTVELLASGLRRLAR